MSGSSVPRFDVVIVPDFSGQRSRAFEVRCLMFLALWMENAGRAREYPLHLACIGDPPESVRLLAQRCGASITTHLPANVGAIRSANKLRGLEIAYQTDQVLLLDTDVLVLSDFSDLARLDQCIAVAPANNSRVPGAYWKKIYTELCMDEPSERIDSIRGELGLSPTSKYHYKLYKPGQTNMHPYYQGGVVFFPANCQLLDLWKSHMRAINNLFSQGDKSAIATKNSDQTSLSTAIEFLRKGTPFQRLPVEFNTHYLHLFRRSPSLALVKLYHAIGFSKRISPNSGPVQQVVGLYRRHLLWKLLREWQLDCRYRRQVSNPWNTLIPACRDALQLSTRMNAACKKYIPPEYQS